MIIGYLRVSTGKQNPGNQQDEIRRFAESRNWIVDNWVTEVASGSKREQDRKLGTLLRKMKRGDTLIVTEISRLSRTLTDVMAIMGRCLQKEINLYTTKEGYTFDNSINSKVLCFAFGLVAEIERNLISMRTREALAPTQSRRRGAWPQKGQLYEVQLLTEKSAHVIRCCIRNKSVTDICKRFDLSRDTFDKFRRSYPSVQQALREKEMRRVRRFRSNRLQTLT